MNAEMLLDELVCRPPSVEEATALLMSLDSGPSSPDDPMLSVWQKVFSIIMEVLYP